MLELLNNMIEVVEREKTIEPKQHGCCETCGDDLVEGYEFIETDEGLFCDILCIGKFAIKYFSGVEH